MMDDTFFQKRMVLRQQRELTQYPLCLPHDQPDKTQRDPEIEDVHLNMVRVDPGEYHLVKIQPVSKDQKYGHKCYRAPVPFGPPFHVDQQRGHEVDYEVQIKDPRIRPVKPRFKIDRLLRNIRVPDQHELIEPEIAPEDRKGKLVLRHIMQVLFIGVFQVSLILQVDDKDRHQGDARYPGAAKRIPAVHGGEPMCIETHQPEPGNDGHHRQREPDDIDRSPYRIGKNISSPSLHGQFAVVDRPGQATELYAQYIPQPDGQDGIDGKERRT